MKPWSVQTRSDGGRWHVAQWFVTKEAADKYREHLLSPGATTFGHYRPEDVRVVPRRPERRPKLATLVAREVSTEYHRNGIGGAPFYCVRFVDHEGNNLLGIVPEQALNNLNSPEGYTVYVVDPANFDAKFRGDNFAAELIAIAKRAAQ